MNDLNNKQEELEEEIDQLKKENEILKADVKLFNTLLESMPDTIYFKDDECRFIKINKAQASALGLKKPEDAVGKTDFEFFNAEHAESAYFDEKNIIRTGRIIINKEEKIQKANGEWFWVTATKVPIRDEKGKIIGIVGISRDITKYKK
ncbi:MAG: PAS domain S-box protein [Bacteroidota bacterium]